MAYLFTALLPLIAIAYFVRVPLRKPVNEIIRITGKVVRILPSSAVSDHWKQRALFRYARIMLASSMQLLLLLGGAVVLLGGAVWLSDLWLKPVPSVADVAFGLSGFVIMVAVYIIYACLNRMNAGKEYGLGDRLLHKMALGLPLVRRASFDFEATMVHGADVTLRNHLFICGLARSGTTLLMRCFHRTGEFRSLTYRDMPFVLMPRLWERLSGPFRAHRSAGERAHGDGLFVDYDSPEAFEEVFWLTFCAERYVKANALTPHDADDETIEQFRDYIGRIAGANDGRYLSKNNNNILRLPVIKKAFPNALVLIPFRDPLQQADSLLKQHKRFLTIQSADRFARQYMEWLGHFEFGTGHKPFCFDGNVDTGHYRPDEIDYWLEIWVSVYEHLLEHVPADAIFVCYETLCNDPGRELKRLFTWADVSCDPASLAFDIGHRQQTPVQGNDDGLLKRAMRIYVKMLERCGKY